MKQIVFFIAIVIISLGCKNINTTEKNIRDTELRNQQSMSKSNIHEKQELKELQTRIHKNIEMIMYCLPVPVDYVLDTAFVASTPKAYVKFDSPDGLTSVVMQGALLDRSFAELGKLIEQQLRELSTSEDQIIWNDKDATYRYLENGLLYFERKWLVDEDETVTVGVSESVTVRSEDFKALVDLYTNSNPSCK